MDATKTPATDNAYGEDWSDVDWSAIYAETAGVEPPHDEKARP